MKDPLGQLRLRFADLRLVSDGQRVRVYAGKDFSGYEVSVAVLTERAATDQRLRRAFADAAGRAGSVAASPVQSDVHASIPWLAARLPEGEAVVRRFVAELDPRHPARTPPEGPANPLSAGSVTLTPMMVDAPPPPVRPDPTLAPMPPPIDMTPAAGPVSVAPTPAPPTPRPTPRPVPAQRPAGPPHRPSHHPQPSPARSTKPSMSPATIITVVVVGLVVLALCCSSGLAELLG